MIISILNINNVNAQCSVVAANAIQITSDINGGNFSTNTYYITRDITIDGNTNFYKADITIAPNVTITIAKTAYVILNYVHLHTCSGMWKGMNVLEGGKLFITQDGDRTSIIEDAEVAVNLDFPSHFINTSDYIFGCMGVVFNRNKTSIKISNLYASTFGSGLLPFNIYGCFFTSRDIPFNYTYPYSFTTNWFGTWFFGVNNANPLPLQLSSPYFKVSGYNYPDNTPNAFLRTTTPNQKPSFGIVLENLGEDGSIVNIGGQSRAGLPLGSNTSWINLFDNVDIGINALSSNLQVNSSVFQKKSNFCPNGIGINAIGDGKISDRKLLINNNSPYTIISGNYINAFFDLGTAINVANYDDVEISETDIRSNKGVTGWANVGQTGINIGNDGNTRKLKVNNNRIFNIDNPIVYSDNTIPSPANKLQQDLSINNNTIAARLLGATPTNKESVTSAIMLFGNNDPTQSIIPDRLPINCNGNIIADVYNGILASGFQTKTFVCTDNQIQLRQQPSTPARPNREQFGIRLNFGTPAIDASNKAIRSIVRNNYINGSACGTCNQTGIYLSQQDFTDVDCNKAENLLHGYRFLGLSNATKFWDNTIEPTNVYGFTLDQGGQIGIQGTASQKAGYCNSDNNWKMPKATWLGYTPKHYMTFVRNAIAKNSPLYVRNTSIFNPEGGGTSNGIQVLVYSQVAGSIKTQIPSFSGCTHCGHIAITNLAPLDLGIENIATLEDIADGTIELIEDDPAQRLYVLQQELYNNLQAAGNQYANNTTIESFVQNNTLGSFDYIYYTQQYLQDSNMAAVDALLAGFPSNNIVDDNYHTYYNWVANMIDSPSYTPNIDDLLDLASLCPAKNGNVVYKARTLYNKLTHSGTIFTDDCPETSFSRGAKPVAIQNKPATTNLLMYPNPATTDININTNEINAINICDLMGRVLIKQQLNFVDTQQINISSLKAGVYLVQMQKIDGSIITNKLIKQ